MQQARLLRRVRTTNEDASSFASKIPTITEPVNDGVLNLVAEGGRVPECIKLWVLLLGSSNDVSSMRVIGWHKCLLDGKTTLWIPTPIGEFVCTAGAQGGVAGSAVLNTELFADTIIPVALKLRDGKIAAGTSIMSDYRIESPADDTIAHIIMPIAGFEKLEFTSDQTTNTATFNVLYTFLDDGD